MLPDAKTVFAPAKVNLSLRVRGRLDNGYHLLESLVAFADIGDQLDVQKSDKTSFSSLMTDPDNLVQRAHATLEAALGRSLNVTMTLEKNLPIAAGLGGGSSDAAACLRALIDLFGPVPDALDVAALALELGADVPVCLHPTASWMAGMGEQVTRLSAFPAADIVLVNPRQALSTAHVFEALQASSDIAPAQPPPRGFDSFDALIGFLQAAGNDLTAPACAHLPVIRSCLETLADAQADAQADALTQAAPHYIAMSGSGASCFCLCAPGTGARVAAAYRQRRNDDWVMAGRLIGPGDTEIDQLGQ